MFVVVLGHGGLLYGAEASCGGGFPCCGVQAVGAQASAGGTRALGHVGGSSCTGTQELRLSGPVVVLHRLTCLATCEVFPSQGSNQGSHEAPALAGRILPTVSPGAAIPLLTDT